MAKRNTRNQRKTKEPEVTDQETPEVTETPESGDKEQTKEKAIREPKVAGPAVREAEPASTEDTEGKSEDKPSEKTKLKDFMADYCNQMAANKSIAKSKAAGLQFMLYRNMVTVANNENYNEFKELWDVIQDTVRERLGDVFTAGNSYRDMTEWRWGQRDFQYRNNLVRILTVFATDRDVEAKRNQVDVESALAPEVTGATDTARNNLLRYYGLSD